MGQSASATANSSRRESNNRNNRIHRSKSKATAAISPMLQADEEGFEIVDWASDFISDIPDECLACIFQSLGSGDRKRCSLVCRRWLRIEGQSRHRLSLLHLVKTPECTNVGLVSVAELCKLLRKLHIDGWKANRVGDEALESVAKNCANLQELVLIGVNPTKVSLEALASNCPNLQRLALCGSDTVGDVEISFDAKFKKKECTDARKPSFTPQQTY